MGKGALLISCLLLSAGPSLSEWGEPINLGPNVNRSSGTEYYPCISASGTRLYYTSPDRPGGYGDDDIWISDWDSANSEWGVPINAGPNVNWEWRDLSPSITFDGSMLYFVSWGRLGGYGMYDIWVSTWEDSMWGPAANVGPNVNTNGIEWSVNISSDGKRLYIASDRAGTLGDLDIWVSEWDSGGNHWGVPINLGPAINTFDREYSPSVSSDGSRLYFAKWGGGLGYVDIYMSEWQDTCWGVASNLGPPVNTVAWDDGPSISSDGAKLFFASGRDTVWPALQDIWVSEWLPGANEGAPHTRHEVVTALDVKPTPFDAVTTVGFILAVRGDVAVKIYDAAGRHRRTLVEGWMDIGHHDVVWDGKDGNGLSLETGVYFIHLETDGPDLTRKVLLLR